MFATIGYEKSTPEDFIATLQISGIEVLVDIRERAQSRRQGFSKTALSLAANKAGIEYIHIRALGDPKEGRDAARAGKIEKFREIFSIVLAAEPAQEAMKEVNYLAGIKRICLMCYERDHRYCHRKMVSDQLEKSLGYKATHLGVIRNGTGKRQERRMLHIDQSATA